MDLTNLFPYFWIYLNFLVFIDLISFFRVVITLPSNLAYAFNIDEEYPILISNRFNGKDAHFGASVVLLPSSSLPGFHGNNNHPHVDDNGEGDKITGWVFIGAPKANSTASLNQSKIFEPGVIWRCSLGGYHHKEICKVVNIDPTWEYDPFDRNLPFRDKKDGGWLGGSMFVGNSERFVSCGSRWINQKYKDSYLMNGICYWLPKDNVISVSETEDADWPFLPSNLSYRLSPLLDRWKQFDMDTSKKISPQEPDKIKFYDWSFGQFGFSIHLTPHGELISGSPGILDWTGSVVYYRDSPEPRNQFRRYNAHPGSPVFSEVLVVPAQTIGHLFETSDYFGYSITSGRFFNASASKNKTQFAAGAPRSGNLSGKVVLFYLEEVKEGRSEGKLELLVEPLEGRETTKGNHYGSYFGHSVLALDVNGDGFDDLLISAPLYGTSIRYKRNAAMDELKNKKGYQQDKNSTDGEDEENSRTIMKSGDEGCVFVYLSTGEEFLLTPQALCGDKLSGARFGMALSSLGDINDDGFNDIAVGAPFENEGRGAVYIYHGGKNFVEFTQKLKPEVVDPSIRTFGWSLSLGVDIDKNGYSDLGVGGYETNQVVVYRTIPIVHFTTVLNSSIPKLMSTTEDFNLTACVNYSGRGKMPSVLAIWVKLIVEMDSEGRRLVALVDKIGDEGAKLLNKSSRRNDKQQVLPVSYQRRLHFRSDGVENCYNFLVTRVGSIDSFMKSGSVPIRLDHWLEDNRPGNRDPKPLQYEISPNGTGCCPSPAVNLTSSKSHFEDFSLAAKLKIPGGKNVTTQKLNIPIGTICEADGNPECLANLTISAWLHNQQTGETFNSSQPFLLGTADILSVIVELENHRETANLPLSLSLKWLSPPVVRRLPSNCEHSSKNLFNLLVCSLRKALKENQKETMTIELDISGVYGGPTEVGDLNIFVKADTSSSLVKPAESSLVVPLKTNMKPQNFTHKSGKIAYSVGNASISTFGFTQAFEIGLEGPSTAAGILISFDIPVNFSLSGEPYQRLISVRKPIITYDGSMKCWAENGSFLKENELLESSSSEIDTAKNKDVFGDNEDYLNFKINDASKIVQGEVRRIRRSLSFKDKQEDNDKYEYGEILRINCDSSRKSVLKVQCLRVICKASHFTPSKKAVVELKLRMWNNAAKNLLETGNEVFEDSDENGRDVEGIAALWIESFGVVRSLSVEGKVFGEKGRLQFTSRLEIPPAYDLPAWILIVSVGGGLLLFIIVTICLKRCGFFRRSKRDELIQRKVQEIERSRLIGTKAKNSSSMPSTASLRTSSPSRCHRNKDKRNSHYKGNHRENGEIPSFSGRGTRILGMEIGSPLTAVKQREMPDAVDLNELRRLYEYDYEDPFY